jgi:hypothetical protein
MVKAIEDFEDRLKPDMSHPAYSVDDNELIRGIITAMNAGEWDGFLGFVLETYKDQQLYRLLNGRAGQFFKRTPRS